MANNIQQANEPTLASVLKLHKEDIMYSINCHQIGEIVSFNPSTQTAEVQIKMLRMMNGELKQYPVLIDCPCIVLSGGSGRLTMPISAGDSCLVLFNDRDIDNWYSGGQSVAPRTERKHNFADAIALVGIRNRQNQITDYLNDGVELKHGNSSIKLKDGYIDIKGNVNIVQNEVDDNSLHAYIISSYHSGFSWYRVYSDGWCEQGGQTSPISAGATGTTNLLKSFKSLDYSIQISSAGAYTAVGEANSCITAITVSSFSITSGARASSPYFWMACGYIA